MSKNEKFTLPEGRLINHSLFTKDAYVDEKGREAIPSYKVELVFDPDDLDSVEDMLRAAAVAEWGAGADEEYNEGKIKDPIKDGDKKAAKRKADGKAGDAYEGKIYLNAHTIFNKSGDDAPGGICVFNEQAEPIEPAMQGDVYCGCWGIAAVTIGAYDIQGKGLTFYLSGFQKTRDGERLSSASDVSEMFEPVGRDQEGGTGGRRRRAG